MTVGEMLDWVLKNWGYLAIIGAMLAAIVKFMRAVDKLTRTVEDTKKTVTELDKKYDSLSKKFDAQSKTIEEMKSRLDAIDTYHCENAERTRILISSTEACLRGMVEIGLNGPVKKGLEDLVTYKTQKASV